LRGLKKFASVRDIHAATAGRLVGMGQAASRPIDGKVVASATVVGGLDAIAVRPRFPLLRVETESRLARYSG
jgi:hypothetical protein